jgi:hypothetical protein
VQPVRGGTAGNGVSRAIQVVPVPTPKAVRWVGSAIGQRTIVATFDAAPGTTYSVSATSKSQTFRGSCKKAASTVTCAVKTTPGSWKVSIIPSKKGATGRPIEKVVKI